MDNMSGKTYKHEGLFVTVLEDDGGDYVLVSNGSQSWSVSHALLQETDETYNERKLREHHEYLVRAECQTFYAA